MNTHHLHQLYVEIEWIKRKIESLMERIEYKPSVVHQIKELKYQIRHKELTIVFSELK